MQTDNIYFIFRTHPYHEQAIKKIISTACDTGQDHGFTVDDYLLDWAHQTISEKFGIHSLYIRPWNTSTREAIKILLHPVEDHYTRPLPFEQIYHYKWFTLKTISPYVYVFEGRLNEPALDCPTVWNRRECLEPVSYTPGRTG